MDTRTSRTPDSGSGRGPGSGGTPPGFTEDASVLNTVKVPSDPAQVVVNHVSFRVELATETPRHRLFDAGRPYTGAARTGAPQAGTFPGTPRAESLHAEPAAAGGSTHRRRPPLVWSGHIGPEDTGARRLLRAARVPLAEPSAEADVATRTLPRISERTPGYAGAPPAQRGPGAPRAEDTAPLIVGPRQPDTNETTQPIRTIRAPVSGDPHGAPRAADPYTPDPADGARNGEPEARGDGPRSRGASRQGRSSRHAYYPGRRLSLGVVLLPLRVFLGFISIYAGMGKLCDPVYFDGGSRGSMVTWLRSLEPWAVATPLYDFALAHPVGAGLTVAFLQVVIGVLTVCGLWQRLAAGTGAVISAALLVTVSWHTVPAYDAPDIIYLAAWSPLIIAGAPVYSVDARLAGEAWRKLGPRVELWDLRRRVLRRGTTLATVIVGSALLVGALLGGAVRATQTVTVPDPDGPPRNELPGTPLPREPGSRNAPAREEPDGTPDEQRVPKPSASSGSGPDGAGEQSSPPSQRETVPAPQPSAPTTSAGPEAPAQPSSGRTTAGDGSGDATATRGPSGAAPVAPRGSGGTGGGNGGGTSGGGDGGNALGGLLG